MGVGDEGDDVGRLPGGGLLPAECGAGSGGGPAQVLGVVESLGLRRQLPVLTAAGVDLLQGLEPGAQLGDLDGSGLSGCLPVLELLVGLSARLVGPGVAAAQGGVVLATQ